MTREEAADMIRNDMRLHHDALSGAYRKALKMAIEALEAQQWIPCSETLPEYDKDVLCYTDAEEFIVGYRVDNWGQDAWITGEFGAGEFYAIAWMPLPEPYTGRKGRKND